jgi:hypothetical protein
MPATGVRLRSTYTCPLLVNSRMGRNLKQSQNDKQPNSVDVVICEPDSWKHGCQQILCGNFTTWYNMGTGRPCEAMHQLLQAPDEP